MSQHDAVYIFLESQKKYISLYSTSLSSYMGDDYYRQSYLKSHAAHSSNKNIDATSAISTSRLKMLSEWLTLDTSIVSSEDKETIKACINYCLKAKVPFPSISINKNLFDRSLVKTGILETMTEVLETIDLYNNNVAKINSIMKSYTLPDVAFYCKEERAVAYNYGKATMSPFNSIVFSDNSSANIHHKELFISSISLKAHNKSLINSLIKKAPTLKIISSLEDKQATTEMFLVHTKNGPEEGFIGEGALYGPLNTAKLFYDERKAQKAAENNRSVINYQIWKVGVNFKMPTKKSEKFEGSTIMSSIISYQEKQMLEELMKNEEYTKLLARAEEYKRLLIEHNIIIEPTSENIEQANNKKRNKI